MEQAGVRLVAEGASQFNNELKRASDGVDNFGRNASSASGGIDLMSVATVALGSALGDLALRGLDAATNAITGFVKSGWEYNVSIENATARLIAFTGSQEAANEALAIAERRAAATPFAFDEMAQSLASLAGVSRGTGEDLETILGIAERLAASNMEEGLTGASRAISEAFSGDFISLQDRFNIPKDQIARLKEMGVTAENLSTVLNDLGITTGLVSGLAQTFDGRMSTLIDTVTKLAGAFTAPIFDLFSGWIADIQIGLDQNIVSWQTWATEVGQSVADSFQTAQEAWTGNWEDAEIIQPVHRFVGNTTLAIKGMYDKIVILGEMVLPRLAAFWDTQVREVEGLQKAWQPFNKVLDSTKGLFDSIGRLGGALRDVLFGVEENTGKANKQFGRANDLGSTLAGFFERLASAIERIAAVIDQVAAGIQRAVDAAGGSFNGLLVPDASGSGLPPVDTGNDPTGTIDNSPLDPTGGGMTQGGNVPKASSPRSASGGVIVNRNSTVISPTIMIPSGVSPATASRIVADGVLQAQRSRGMA